MSESPVLVDTGRTTALKSRFLYTLYCKNSMIAIVIDKLRSRRIIKGVLYRPFSFFSSFFFFFATREAEHSTSIRGSERQST